MNCGVVHRHSWDPALLWLWCRPSAAALIQPPAWEPPYAMGAALKIKNKQKKIKKISLHDGEVDISRGKPRSMGRSLEASLEQEDGAAGKP